MWIKLVTFALWLGVGASALAWLMPWWGAPAQPTVPPTVAMPSTPSAPPADWSTLWSRPAASAGPAAATAEAARVRLVGVAGPVRASSQGVALLSVDGQTPRAYRPGDRIDEQRVVLEVTAHTVKIGQPGGTTSLTLEAPKLPPPATGRPADAPTAGAAAPKASAVLPAASTGPAAAAAAAAAARAGAAPD